MNDLLRLSDAPCACGSPLQAVASVEGRADDVFLLGGGAQRDLVTVTPDVIRNAVVDADRRILDFRVVQTGPRRVELSLARELAGDAAAAAAANLAAALAKAGAGRSTSSCVQGSRFLRIESFAAFDAAWQPGERAGTGSKDGVGKRCTVSRSPDGIVCSAAAARVEPHRRAPRLASRDGEAASGVRVATSPATRR